jgi:hypothetical protein
MKILILCLTLAFFTACQEKPKDTPPPVTNPEPVKEVPKTTQDDGTSIKIDNNGVDVQSKDGNNKTDVKISRDTTELEIKK